MAITTFVDTLEIKNTSNQVVIINIKPSDSNAIFKKAGGNVQLQSGAIVEAEDLRFDAGQIRNMRRNGLIDTTAFRRAITNESSDVTATDVGT